MDKATPPKTSLKSLIRKAWKNRRDYHFVTISKAGDVKAGWNDVDGLSSLGNVSDYFTKRTDAMNIQLCKGNTIVFTFAYDN